MEMEILLSAEHMTYVAFGVINVSSAHTCGMVLLMCLCLRRLCCTCVCAKAEEQPLEWEVQTHSSPSASLRVGCAEIIACRRCCILKSRYVKIAKTSCMVLHCVTKHCHECCMHVVEIAIFGAATCLTTMG